MKSAMNVRRIQSRDTGLRLTEQERFELYDLVQQPMAGVLDIVESQAVRCRLVGRC